MMDSEIRIIKQDTETTFDRDGKIVERIRMQFKDGDHGPFLIRFDKATFSAVAAQQAIDAFVRELRAVRG